MSRRAAWLAALLMACAEEPRVRTPVPPPPLDEAVWAQLLTLSPEVLPAPPPDPTNQYADDNAAAALGETFFFTPIFSGRLLSGDNSGSASTLGHQGETGKVACSGCHLPEGGFSDTRSPSKQTSLASGWGKRRAPSLLDVGHSTILMWDGRHDTLYNQVFGAFESPVEMNTSRLFVARQVFAEFHDAYEAVFGELPPLDDTERFPALSAEVTGCTPNVPGEPGAVCKGTLRGVPGDGAEFDSMDSEDQDAVTRVVVNVGKAIAAYERRLSCGPGRFDAFMHGDYTALTELEQRGAELFVTTGQCVSCHSGPFMSDEAFHNVGLAPRQVAGAFVDLDDAGASVGIAASLADPLNSRGVFSDGDDGRLDAFADPANAPLGGFRTPKLRCVSERPSWFHTAHVISLEAVVDFFNRGGDTAGYLGTSEIAPLGLSDEDVDALFAFLNTL